MLGGYSFFFFNLVFAVATFYFSLSSRCVRILYPFCIKYQALQKRVNESGKVHGLRWFRNFGALWGWLHSSEPHWYGVLILRAVLLPGCIRWTIGAYFLPLWRHSIWFYRELCRAMSRACFKYRYLLSGIRRRDEAACHYVWLSRWMQGCKIEWSPCYMLFHLLLHICIICGL